MGAVQEHVDRFYMQRGPCCAGCDWWEHLNPAAGLCTRSPPIPGQERSAALGIENASLNPGAGQALTPREYHCGEFTDSFNWSALPPAYLRTIGFHERKKPAEPLRTRRAL